MKKPAPPQPSEFLALESSIAVKRLENFHHVGAGDSSSAVQLLRPFARPLLPSIVVTILL